MHVQLGPKKSLQSNIYALLILKGSSISSLQIMQKCIMDQFSWPFFFSFQLRSHFNLTTPLSPTNVPHLHIKQGKNQLYSFCFFCSFPFFYHFASWCLGTHSFCTLMHVLFKCYYYYLFICLRIKTPTTLCRVSWRFFFSLSFTFC